MSELETVITSRERDLGGFTVRRILPYATHRMVGPFIFFDHMGPAELKPGQDIGVRPHPHIHLATVTYLFEGKIRHRDSLGSDQLIEPGAINWMTAGHGIVHSERSPDELLKKGGKLNGIQCWVALPEEFEDVHPSFDHHPAHTLPNFEIDGVSCRLLLGQAYGKKSPVKTHSDIFYLDIVMPKGTVLKFSGEGREAAAYLVNGKCNVNGAEIEPCSMAIAKSGGDLLMTASMTSRLMLLGGTPVGKRFIFWNFVSSRQENIEAAKIEWAKMPGHSDRFPRVPGDDKEFIPLPS